MTAVAYYATPYEVVTKLLLLPAAVTGVVFPAFSASFAQDRNRAALLFGRSVKYILLALFPIVLLMVALAHNGLTLWLGADFARHSTSVVQWLAVGVLANGLALVPFSFVQGIGRPDLTAKLHLVELPIYLVMLLWLIRADGIEGAAIAWTTRSVLDALALFVMGRRFLSAPSPMALQDEIASRGSGSHSFFGYSASSHGAKGSLFAGCDSEFCPCDVVSDSYS